MPVVYGGVHSVVFIRLSDSATKHSWSDLHLIPESRPTIALPEPKIQLIEIPGRSKRIDLTDCMPGGLTYGPRSGEFTFYVDHDQWNGWKNAYNKLSEFFNGDKFAVYLMDNVDKLYEGRVYLTEYNPEDSYSTATLHYELEPDVVTDGYIRATFKDSSTYGGTVLQESTLKRNTMPKYNGVLPQHPGYKFDYWTPSLSTISSNTTYTAVYRAVQSYTIKFVDWDGTVLKSSAVNEDTKPVPPSDPTRRGYIFTGWSPELTAVTTSQTYTATYKEAETFNHWYDVNERIRNGTYKTYYNVGDTVPLTIGTEYDGLAQIVAIDGDVDANGNAIPLSFITVDCLNTMRAMNSSDTNTGGYPNSEMKLYIDSLEDELPSNLRSMLIAAQKTSRQTEPIKSMLTINTKLWIPSEREIINPSHSSGSSYEDGVIYPSSIVRVNKKIGNNIVGWWLRSADNNNLKNNSFNCAIPYNDIVVDGNYPATTLYGIALGFCVGLSST